MKKYNDKKLFFYHRKRGDRDKRVFREVTERKLMIYTLLINGTKQIAKIMKLLILLFKGGEKRSINMTRFSKNNQTKIDIQSELSGYEKRQLLVLSSHLNLPLIIKNKN